MARYIPNWVEADVVTALKTIKYRFFPLKKSACVAPKLLSKIDPPILPLLFKAREVTTPTLGDPDPVSKPNCFHPPEEITEARLAWRDSPLFNVNDSFAKVPANTRLLASVINVFTFVASTTWRAAGTAPNTTVVASVGGKNADTIRIAASSVFFTLSEGGDFLLILVDRESLP